MDTRRDDSADLLAQLNQVYRRPLLAFFRRRTGNQQEAEDLTQDVFVRLLRSHRFADVARSETYVFTIAANLLRDRARSPAGRLARAHFALQPGQDFHADAPLVEDRGPERVLIGRETLLTAVKALAELPARTREIFVLFRFESMSQREIAALYDISVSAVEKHVARALAHLAQRMSAP